jgi:hypothetical protein
MRLIQRTNPINAKNTKPAPRRIPGKPDGTKGVKLSLETDPEHNADKTTNRRIDTFALLDSDVNGTVSFKCFVPLDTNAQHPSTTYAVIKLLNVELSLAPRSSTAVEMPMITIERGEHV